jgi:hypothetical protein
MPWYAISLDELQANEAKRQAEHIEPIQKVTEFMDYILSELLGSLGVDCSKSKIAIGFQQQQLGINVVSLDPEQLQVLCSVGNYDFNANSLGLYVFQNHEPKFFIPDPKISEGRVVVDFFSFDSNTLIGTGAIRVPFKR